MKSILSFLITLLLNSYAISQISKDNWLVGGNAKFSVLKNSSEASLKFKQTNFQINPTIGYFLADKFAGGLRISYTYGNNSINNSSHVLAIGPFIRYYFLPKDKVFNILADGSYSYGIISGQGSINTQKSNTYSLAAGPVLYFNSSVGLEFLFGYSSTKVNGFAGSNNELQFGIGFQIHFERDK